jgi:sugar O-acyltransferase (sialic acid O-acetyltransferase NeuD family)
MFGNEWSRSFAELRKPGFIVGAGGFAREVMHHFPGVFLGMISPEGFDIPEKSLRKVLPHPPLREDCFFVVGVGDSRVREKLTGEWLEQRYQLGKLGRIICPGVQITCDVSMGIGVILNLNATIGHDCVLEDFVTVLPGANISGNVTLKHGATVGTGASIREGVTIGRYAFVGMGAVVTKDVPDGETWVGNPARVLSRSGPSGS